MLCQSSQFPVSPNPSLAQPSPASTSCPNCHLSQLLPLLGGRGCFLGLRLVKWHTCNHYYNIIVVGARLCVAGLTHMCVFPLKRFQSVVSVCARQGQGRPGRCMPVRRPRLVVAIVACVSVSSLPISLALSVSVAVSAFCRGLQSKERKPRYKVTHCRVWRGSSIAHHSAIFRGGRRAEGLTMGGCAFVTMFTQIFKDNPTISKGLLCNFSSHFIVPGCRQQRRERKKRNKNV